MPAAAIFAYPLTCSACSGAFRGRDYDRAQTQVSCRSCGKVFELRSPKADPMATPPPERFTGPWLPSEAGIAPQFPEDLPHDLSVEVLSQRLRVVRRWLGLLTLPFTAFALGVGAFWLSVATATFIRLNPENWLPPAALTVFTLPLLYVAAAHFLNQTVIEATADRLTITHGPLPWPGGRSWPRTELRRLFCEGDEPSRAEDGGKYRLVVVGRSGLRTVLLSGFSNPAALRWLEVALEQRLAIKDRSVDAELEK